MPIVNQTLVIGLVGKVFHRFGYYNWQKNYESQDIIHLYNQTTKKIKEIWNYVNFNRVANAFQEF